MESKILQELKDDADGLEFNLPKDLGICRTVIVERETQVVFKPENSKHFNALVDNPLKIPEMADVMFGPCIDSTGYLRGICQLHNKKGLDAGNKDDVNEFKKLLPILGEIIYKLE